MNYARSKLRGIKRLYDNFPKVVTHECFYRGSTPLTTTLSSLSKGRGSSQSFAWIPAKSMRE